MEKKTSVSKAKPKSKKNDTSSHSRNGTKAKIAELDAIKSEPVKAPKTIARVGKAAISKAKRKAKESDADLAKRKGIEATIAELDAIKSDSDKVNKLIALFKSWLMDESGYDERVLPELMTALDNERRRVGARTLFEP